MKLDPNVMILGKILYSTTCEKKREETSLIDARRPLLVPRVKSLLFQHRETLRGNIDVTKLHCRTIFSNWPEEGEEGRERKLEEARYPSLRDKKGWRKLGDRPFLPLENVIIPGMYSTFFANQIYNSVTYRAFQILGRGRVKTHVISTDENWKMLFIFLGARTRRRGEGFANPDQMFPPSNLLIPPLFWSRLVPR